MIKEPFGACDLKGQKNTFRRHIYTYTGYATLKFKGVLAVGAPPKFATGQTHIDVFVVWEMDHSSKHA